MSNKQLAARFPKRCSCGRAHTSEEWLKLPLVGLQRFPWGEVLELRNCVCGSTRAVEVQEPVIDACAVCSSIDEVLPVGDLPACSFCAEMLRAGVERQVAA